MVICFSQSDWLNPVMMPWWFVWVSLIGWILQWYHDYLYQSVWLAESCNDPMMICMSQSDWLNPAMIPWLFVSVSLIGWILQWSHDDLYESVWLAESCNDTMIICISQSDWLNPAMIPWWFVWVSLIDSYKSSCIFLKYLGGISYIKRSNLYTWTISCFPRSSWSSCYPEY